MSQEQVRRPVVTLTGGASPGAAAEPELPPPSHRHLVLLLAPLLLAVLLGLAPMEEPPAEPELAAEVVLLDDQLLVTQGGVLVVALELRNPGRALRVQSAVAYAQPVVDDPVVQAPEKVRPAATRRFVTLLAPDCRLLQPGSALRFSASLMLRVGRGAAGQDLVVDLSAAHVVRERVASLCRRA